jgi:uncharacterized membrane protein
MTVAVEEYFKEIAGLLALGIEAFAVVVVGFGALQSFLRVIGLVFQPELELLALKQVWLRFASWIVISLEFALAADIIRTAIAPTWKDIGQLAAIAAIRTALNYYLEKDIDAATSKFEQPRRAETRLS